ncbi:MAG: hydrogenase iron-sulfur subunit [Deltaproteobacteria bacterium]|nr:hydrogenase iron-sulfur subunit [Deltaproteobacteria bacterium]
MHLKTMYQTALAYGRKGVLAIEGWADRIFTPRYNPFHYLGAIAIFFLWLLLISCVYLFIFYEIGAPYESLKYITEKQWYLGGIMRSIHRYAADGMVIASILHLLHVYLTDRYRCWRWVAWVSGIALLGAVWITGVIGYWMVWDEKSQIIADLTAGLLDYFPIFGESLSMSFTSNNLITNFFFFVALFIHIMVPVLLFIALWIHVVRISKPVINPPKVIAAIIVCIIMALAVIKPAASLQPANTNKLISIIGLDWFYLFIYPVLNGMPAWLSWVMMSAVTLTVTIVPWLIRSKKQAQAEIIKSACTGCSQCFEDCPYEAIHMTPRTDGRPYDMEAFVISKRCASCGICVGSCSFNAVNFPDKTEKDIVQEIKHITAGMSGGKEPHILGIVCSSSTDIRKIIDPATSAIKEIPTAKIITIPCAGMIQPSWIELSLNSGANGVFICGCQIGDCHYRLGNTWLEDRLMGKRLPILRQNIDRSLLRVYWHSALQTKDLLAEIKTFQEDIKTKRQKDYMPEKSRMKKGRLALASITLSIPAALVFYFSDANYIFSNQNDSLLKLGIKHAGKRVVECDEFKLLAEAAKKYSQELKQTGMAQMDVTRLGNCSRERHPVSMEMYIDNEKRLTKSYKPSGWKRDGSSFVYEKFLLSPGSHSLLIKMRDGENGNLFDYTFEDSIEIRAGQIIAIDFDERSKRFFIR